MNEPENASPATPGQEYLAFWNRCIAGALERRFGGVGVARVEPPPETPAQEEGGLLLRVFGAKAGEQVIVMSSADTLVLAKVLSTEAPGDVVELSDTQRDAIVDIFRQIATMVRTSDWLGFDGELEVSPAESIDWQPAVSAAFQFSTEHGPLCEIRSYLSADFAAALDAHAIRQRSDELHAEAPAEQPSAQEQMVVEAERDAARAIRDDNLDLLLDVELDVTLRFGQRQIPLGEVLAIAPGAVVELDQQIHDPAELLIGDKVIALGEIVVVDGNYGFRVTGLASREERLQSLRS